MTDVPGDSYRVRGGIPLSGVLRPCGSKNAALPILAASLLTDGEVKLRNLPDIRDVRTMLTLLESLGVSVSGTVAEGITLDASSIDPDTIDRSACREIRASILLAGPLTARTGRVMLPPPGGDIIGKRRLDTHFLALEQMGAIITMEDRMLSFKASGLEGRYIFLDEPSVTATENALMAASIAAGETVIYNAACEPNVQDLAAMLKAMGADVSGTGTNRIHVRGSGGLLGGCSHSVVPDHIEIGSFIGLAACCGGRVRIPDVPEDVVRPIMNGFSKLGVEVVAEEGMLVIDGTRELMVRPDRGGAIPTVYDSPWPGFSPDLTSTAVVLATQSRGISLIFEKMFESRLFFVDKLVSMGADIIQCDPHRVVVSGPSKLHGTDVSSPDIRAGMALLTAALCADGTSVIRNVHQIQRGYQDLVERLRGLGADISPES
ncbi:MAG: UDP-N-acetylglucosamine 1-carboxyvinyltransferase [Candidatus Fermentibacteraceae bacterium]|nr:UDP-N-acetylglucosamine 1-carboxyvinyltransferase [Candidatus Fermentibacteraceae bacterium]MBN2609134.1 UDP-N-acetylglucosamine 1-carboxyvinyltransferase [Candidatus Fermentibacteraceae bacterium]